MKLWIAGLAGLAGSALAAMTLATPALGEEAATIEPGLWSYSADTFLVGLKKGQQCVKREQVSDFLTGPRNRHYRCTYPIRVVGGGKVNFSGYCLDKGDRHRYDLVVRGAYKPESFELQGNVSGRFFGVSLSAPMSIHARRIAATCPEG